MKYVFIFFINFLLISSSYPQDSINAVNSNKIISDDENVQSNKTSLTYPYKTSFKKDAPVIAIGVGLTYLGNTLIKNKKPLTIADLANKTKDKVPFFDRGNAGYYSERIDKASYIPFLASMVRPLVILAISKKERTIASQILVMYVESLSITSALFTMSAGTINRSRPLVYGNNAPTDQRLNRNNQRSFFAGHTAATASASFFAAKVYQDLHPDSKLRTYVWIISAAIPAVVGYMRYQSGFHFLSDNLLGYVVGAASGILIPEWHKSKSYKNVSFVPRVSKDFKGLTFLYDIK